jgi:hypothetical protein
LILVEETPILRKHGRQKIPRAGYNVEVDQSCEGVRQNAEVEAKLTDMFLHM